jgi:hypothetical protein
MNPYVQQIDQTKAANSGGVVRRKAANVEKYKYRADLIAYVIDKGWHMFEYGDQIVIICSSAPLQQISATRDASIQPGRAARDQ